MSRHSRLYQCLATQIAKFMGPTWVQPGSCWPQMGPMMAPWALLSGHAAMNSSRLNHDCNEVRFLPITIPSYADFCENLLEKYLPYSEMVAMHIPYISSNHTGI